MSARLRIRLLELQATLEVTDRDGQVQSRLVAEQRSAELDVEVSETDAAAIALRLAGSGR